MGEIKILWLACIMFVGGLVTGIGASYIVRHFLNVSPGRSSFSEKENSSKKIVITCEKGTRVMELPPGYYGPEHGGLFKWFFDEPVDGE